MHTIKKIEYDVEVIDRMPENELLKQIIYRQDRQTSPNAQDQVDAEELLAEANARIDKYSQELAAAGFSDIARQLQELLK